jgi:cysteine-rich repeat protein
VGRHFDRLDAWLIATSLVASVAIALAHCGDQAECGNNVQEEGEACDKGPLNGVENSGCSAACKIAPLNVASLQISITKLKDEAEGFTGSGCSDLQSTQQHVVLSGPKALDEVWECSKSSTILNDVPPGDYTLTVTLLGSAGQPITKEVQSAQVTAEKGKATNLTVNFAFDDFTKTDYIGTLYFAPSWGTTSTGCAMASPAVTEYGVTLRRKDGTIVAGKSTGNRKLDGMSGPCFVPGPNGTAEAVADLPWGHYDLTFTGYAGATLAYCKTFDVFAGPGVATPTYSLVVPSADADAGVTCP